MKRKYLKKSLLAAMVLVAMTSGRVHAQSDSVKTMDIYGFIMMDAGHNFDQIHPDWYDVVRPTKLPSFENEFGPDGNTFFSVRQTRLGFKNYFRTGMGELFTQFEFEMFGTGVDAGQTTIRLRHAYAELGKWGAGQYWSPFMDIDVFPNTVEYWGPTGMAFFRNVQLRFMPIKGQHRLTIALERPGASADQGSYAERIQLAGAIPKAKFPLPDLSAEYHRSFGFGYIELAGIVRKMEWEDLNPTTNVTGDATGYGFNLSTNIKLGEKIVFRGAGVWGEGIQNYMNDAPVDVSVKDSVGAIEGVALPMVGATGFFDINWNERFSSSIGYSFIDMDNTAGQNPSAFNKGQYAVGNIAYYPVKNAMIVAEYQWGDRENYRDGFSSSISKVQLSFKYNFSESFWKRNQ